MTFVLRFIKGVWTATVGSTCFGDNQCQVIIDLVVVVAVTAALRMTGVQETTGQETDRRTDRRTNGEEDKERE